VANRASAGAQALLECDPLYPDPDFRRASKPVPGAIFKPSSSSLGED
jgi:hypothetical protein